MTRPIVVFVAAVALVGCGSTPPAAEAPARETSAQTIPITTKSPEALSHFEKGEMLLDNLRVPEAAVEFREALKLDPDFVLARAYLGQAIIGPDGLKEIEAARAAASSLPEAERTLIESIAANRRGDFPEATAAITRVTELAPGDWRGHYFLGQRLLGDQKYSEAVTALKKATGINPDAGGAQNMLGYAALRQGDTAGATAAFTEYVRILPQEPNPQDSLGEAHLAAGRFKEAEEAFQKALELSPQFWNAHQGIAYARFYAGDWAGGREALNKAKAAAPTQAEKQSVDDDMAAAAIAQRNTAEALRILDAAERTEGAQLSDVAFIPVRRAQALIDAGRPKEALAPLAAALESSESGGLPQGISRNLRREALRTRITAEALLGDKEAAQKTAAALDQDAAARGQDPFAQSAMHYGRGQLALAQGDVAGARSHFQQCSKEDQICKWRGVLAAEKAGDAAAATAAREELLKVYARDPAHLIARSRLATRQTT